MTDKITLQVEIDLDSLGAYDPEEDRYGPPSIAQAVVAKAASQLVDELAKDPLLRQTRDRITDELIRARVEARVEEVLAKPIRPTNEWGEPMAGPEITVTDLIDKEIKKQLEVTHRNSFGGSTTTLQRVISEVVNTRLETDLKAAFNSARQAMLDAAADAGKKALQAAVAAAIR